MDYEFRAGDYVFHVGDYVEDIKGRIGYIQTIYNCGKCGGDGILEFVVLYTNKEAEWFTIYNPQRDFFRYKRIGRYEFTEKDEDKIESLCEEYTKSFPFYKLEPDRLDMGRIDLGVIGKKINELVEVVNELKKRSNKT